LIEFKKGITDYADKLLSQLDKRIAKLELEYENRVFKFLKRLERVETAKYGYDLTTDDNHK